MKLNRVALLLAMLFVCLTANSVWAQKTWEKPYQKWSREDVLKILGESPWSQSFTPPVQGNQQDSLVPQTASRGGSNPGSTSRIFGISPIVVRLYSALPVRQALLRWRQIQAGYDKMDDAKKAEFDEANKGLLACPLCKDYYIVTVNKTFDAQQSGIEEGIFQRAKLDDLKGFIKLLNDKDEARELFQFSPSKNGNDMAALFFKRKDDKNSDLLSSDSKKVKLWISTEYIRGSNPYGRYFQREFEFNLSKMMIGDKLEF